MDTSDPVAALAKALNAYVVSQDHVAAAAEKLAAETQPVQASPATNGTEGGSGGFSSRR